MNNLIVKHVYTRAAYYKRVFKFPTLKMNTCACFFTSVWNNLLNNKHPKLKFVNMNHN